MEENKNEEVLENTEEKVYTNEEVKSEINTEEKVEEVNKKLNIDDIKKGTKDTFNTAKEQMKNLNFKEEANASKNLLIRLFKEPLEVVKEVSEKENDSIFKTALIIVAAWLVVIFFGRLLYYATSKYLDFQLLPTLKVLIAPILSLVTTAGALYVLNQKKPIKNILTATIIAKIPAMFTSAIALITYIASQASYVTTPVNSILRAISLTLEYFVVKFVLGEDDSKALISFVKVECIYYAVYFVLSFLGIYL